MEEQLISFETAKLAKEKGFLDKTFEGEIRISQQNIYSPDGNLHSLEKALWSSAFKLKDCFNTPTQSLLQKWLREKYNIHLLIEPYYDEQRVLVYGFDLITEKSEEETILERGFKTYEEALEIGLQEALKLIKIRNNDNE